MESSAPSGSALLDAISRGQFRKALSLLGHLESMGPSAQDNELLVTKAELLDRTGRSRDAAVILKHVARRKDATDAIRSRCCLVEGRIAKRLGHLEESVSAFRRALRHAELADSPEYQCWSKIRLLKVLGELNGPEAVAALREELQSEVVRVGAVDLTVIFHVFCAEIEARGGFLGESRRLTSLAASIALRSPSSWLQCLLHLQSSCLAYLEGAFAESVRSASAVLRIANSNGDADSKVAGLTNLAAAYLALGHVSRADRCISAALGCSDPDSLAQVLLLETLAEAKLAQHDLEGCASLLAIAEDRMAEYRQSRGCWHVHWNARTRARLLCKRGNYEEADRVLTKMLDSQPEANKSIASLQLEVMRSAIGLRSGNIHEAVRTIRTILTSSPMESTLLFALSQSLIGAITCGASGSLSSTPYFSRALRLLTSCSEQGVNTDFANHLREDVSQMEGSDHELSLCSDEVVRRPLTIHLRLDTTSEIHNEPSIDILEMLSVVGCLEGCSSDPQLVGEEVIRLTKKLDWIDHGRVEVLDLSNNVRLDTVCSYSSTVHRRQSTVGRSVGSEPMEITWRSRTGAGVKLTLVPTSDPLHQVGCILIFQLLKRIGVQTLGVHTDHEPEIPLAAVDHAADRYGVFDSERMRALISSARRIAPTNESVLLVGESGTGKEVLARIIHDASLRASRPLIPFNCASVPRELFDSHLFGHRKGAFTGATESFSGVVRAAERGSIFLDEVGDLPLDMQPKLLRFLDSLEIHPLGESQPQKVDVRIIAATNAPLEQLVAEKRFREDLYYRLNVIKIKIPPLRERREDIPRLVQRFVQEASQDLRKQRVEFSEEAIAHLVLCEWPGNVRQLANEVRRIVAMAEPGERITAREISSELVPSSSAATNPPDRDPGKQLVSVRLDCPLEEAVAAVERALISHSLRVSEGRNQEAADRLGLSRKGLYLKRKRLGL